MKICIVGAGAIGGFIGTRLARSGNAVSAVARGATAAALRARGWRLEMGGELLTAPARVTDDPRELGPQDVVVIAVKAPALAESAPRIAPLLARDTVVLTAMNGVPWWFFNGIGGRYEGLKLTSTDPQGRIAAAIPTRHVVGCVVHVTASTPEPGLARHGFANRLIIGEPAGGASERASALAQVLARAGFDAHPDRHLVQALGQHDHEPHFGADRRDVRPDPRRPPDHRVLSGGDAGGRRDRHADRLPHPGKRRGSPGGGAAARPVQDIDAAGRRGRQAARDRCAAEGGA